MTVLTLILAFSFSAFADNSTQYFKNPIRDTRFNFQSCAVQGALLGILDNEPGSVICFGKLNGSNGRTEYIVFYNKSTRKTHYFEQTSYEFTNGAGEQEGGVQEYTLKLRAVTKELTPALPARVGTWKLTTTWFYSEGGTTVKGKIPGLDVRVEYPLFGLASVDEEVEQFKAEIGRR